MGGKLRDFIYTDFRIHEIKGYIGNIHIIEYDDSMLLLDSGCVNDVRRIENYCKKVIRRPLKDIKLILLTHMHPDHSGGAIELRRKYRIPIAAYISIDNWYAGLGGMLQHKIDCYLATTVAYKNHNKLERILYKRKVKPDYLLKDGDLVPFFSDWQALHVPGHTLHDLAIYHEKELLLCIGDLICDVKGRMQLPLPVIFPEKMAKSFQRLSLIQAETIFRSHGKPIITKDNSELFAKMQKLLKKPPSQMTKSVYRVSTFSLEARRELKRIK